MTRSRAAEAGMPFRAHSEERSAILREAYARVCALLIGQGGYLENEDFRSRIASLIVEIQRTGECDAEELARATLQRLAPLSNTEASYASRPKVDS